MINKYSVSPDDFVLCSGESVNRVEGLDIIIDGGSSNFKLYGLDKNNYDIYFDKISNNGNLLIFFQGEIYNLAELHLENANRNISIPNILYNLYQKHDNKMFNFLNGVFRIIIIDFNKGRLYAASDHIGMYPLYYIKSENNLYLSNNPVLIRKFSSGELDLKWFCNTIYRLNSVNDLMPLTDLKKISPGSYLDYKEYNLIITKYWDLSRLKKFSAISEEEAIKGFKALFEKAVKSRLPNDTVIGCELSGGIDSSGVLSILLNFARDKKVITFSHVGNEIRDEIDDIKIIINYLKAFHNKFISNTNVSIINSIRELMTSYGFPFYTNFSLYSDQLYERVYSENVHYLYSGYGGDQFVSSHVSKIHSQLALNGQFNTLIEELKLKYKSRSILIPKFFIILLKVKAKILFLFYYKIKGKFKRQNVIFLNKNKIKIFRNYFNEYYAKIKPLLKIDDSLLFNISSTGFYQRVELSYFVGRQNSFKYRFPLLDKDLMEFYWQLPDYYKYHNGISRYIYRKSLNELLPKEIQYKRNKGINVIPLIYMRLLNNMDEIFEYLYALRRLGCKNRIFHLNELIFMAVKVKQYLQTDSNMNITEITQFMRIFTLLIYLEEFHDGPQ